LKALRIDIRQGQVETALPEVERALERPAEDIAVTRMNRAVVLAFSAMM